MKYILYISRYLHLYLTRGRPKEVIHPNRETYANLTHTQWNSIPSAPPNADRGRRAFKLMRRSPAGHKEVLRYKDALLLARLPCLLLALLGGPEWWKKRSPLWMGRWYMSLESGPAMGQSLCRFVPLRYGMIDLKVNCMFLREHIFW